MNKFKQIVFKRGCTIQSAENMEKKLFPRFCIGNIAFMVMGVILVIIEWTH
ncbi:hypothetical protein [Sporosarcina sp. P20a]|uniref:hypothetical protein n=1 Tax=Sporosarcina sp. P20a TaxID=2048256 RepID=UPI00130437FA|nr:hypothetical protein [Sporosarcina sp. P20a]